MNTNFDDLSAVGPSLSSAESTSPAAPASENIPRVLLPPNFKAASHLGSDSETSPADDAATIGSDTVARIARSAHSAIDRLAATVAPMMDGVKGTADGAGQIPAHLATTARSLIRDRPILAVSAALVAGAAVLRLTSRTRH